jgi:hypothetical protein
MFFMERPRRQQFKHYSTCQQVSLKKSIKPPALGAVLQLRRKEQAKATAKNAGQSICGNGEIDGRIYLIKQWQFINSIQDKGNGRKRKYYTA